MTKLDPDGPTVASTRTLPSGAFLERLEDGNFRIRQVERTKTAYVYLSPMDVATLADEVGYLADD